MTSPDEQTGDRARGPVPASTVVSMAGYAQSHCAAPAEHGDGVAQSAEVQPASDYGVRILETVLLAATEPLAVAELRRVFDEDIDASTILAWLQQLGLQWRDRGVNLKQTASGWRFQTRPEMQAHIDRVKQVKPPKYSRAVMETLAIIAYRQPVTRGDIEDIRGVTVSPNIVKTLEARGWIDTVGHRETPGRPALYATTRRFLDELGLRSLSELPSLSEIEGLMERSDDPQN
jgi:segregation and condensation protein B